MFNMNCKQYLFLVFVLSLSSDAVKVNMQGSLSIGKDVMDTITHYFKKSYINGRRSMTPLDTDAIQIIIKASNLCRSLQFCEKKLEKFLNEYITILTKTIDSIFDGILNENTKTDNENQAQHKSLVFEEELKTCLNDIRRILREVDSKITEENEAFLWTNIIKKISAMFQEMSINFVTDRLDGSPSDINEAKKKLTQKLVIGTIMVEGKFESKLCSDYGICTTSHECTSAMNTLLQTFQDMDDDKVKSFVRFFYGALPETQFFSLLSDVTVNEFQIILNDMAYSDTVPSKKVLLTVQKTVQVRQDAISTGKHVINGRDVELVHAILSDMDHFYRRTKANEFHGFLRQYFDWIRTGGRLGPHIRHLMKDIRLRLATVPPELLKKLINEVRVFLEITVDPEK